MAEIEKDVRVKLNVGGQIFETMASTLKGIPGSFLATLTTDHPSYDRGRGEFFFDRNPRLFPYVLDAFRQGEVHFPHSLCAPTIYRELSYWGLEKDNISTCCWKNCCEWEEEQKAQVIISNAYAEPQTQLEGVVATSAWTKRMHQIWLFLEDGHSSNAARVWSFLYLALLILSTVVISLETVPGCRIPITRDLEAELGQAWKSSNGKIGMYYTSEEHPVLRHLHNMCSIIFVIELVIRFVTCPSKIRFFCSFYNIIDILGILPMFIFTLINMADPYFWIKNNMEIAYNVIGISSVLRAVRILKMVKYSRGLQVILLAIRASIKELLLLALVITIAMVIFSTSVYYAELQAYEQFNSIPDSLWWSIVTLTTVGYGDMIPVTSVGKILAGICACSGILFVGLPIPVIANNFRLYYSYASLKRKIEKKKALQLEVA